MSYGRSKDMAVKEISSKVSIEAVEDIVLNDASSNKSKERFEDMTMKDRVAFVQKKCSQNTAWFKETATVPRQPWFFVDDEHLLMVCDLPKVASHQLAAILQTINNQTGNLWKYRGKTSRHVTAEEANASPHAKVMFVREPLERLLSAYIDKKAIGKGVSFEGFLKNVLKTPIERINDHHQRFYIKCKPCEVQYQYIGTLSTFQKDAQQIFGSTEFQRTDKNKPSQRVASDNLQKYFKDVDPSVIHALWEKFRIDYEVFGFPYPSHLINRVP